MTPDITPTERQILSGMRSCPDIYIGNKSLTLLESWSRGYETALRTAGLDGERVLLPREALNKFAASFYHDRKSSDCFSMILKREHNEELAFELFFEMLDVVLKNNGYEPLN